MSDEARNQLIDRCVVAATWKASAFGFPQELRRMWANCLEHGSVWEEIQVWISHYFKHPDEIPALDVWL